MTLGNMRANGVRTIAAQCSGHGCNHHFNLDESNYPDDERQARNGSKLKVTTGPRKMAEIISRPFKFAGFSGGTCRN
jgi:hypothetical protein